LAYFADLLHLALVVFPFKCCVSLATEGGADRGMSTNRPQEISPATPIRKRVKRQRLTDAMIEASAISPKTMTKPGSFTTPT
jgi:hypothetical protein